MGLFNRKKKAVDMAPKTDQSQKQTEPTQKNETAETQNSMSEFDRDIRELLDRDDIQCRQDICEAEYAKAQKLLEQPSQSTLQRAYDLMGNLASQFEYIPAMMWMGDFAENALEDFGEAASWYKAAADRGDGNGARCYADMLIAGKGVNRDFRQAINYYADAADKGVPEAAFVLGEYFRNSGDREHALKAYQQALAGGYSPAQIRIDQMNRD